MNGTLMFYKQIGSSECDDFRGTYAGPGKLPGQWTILTRPNRLQSLDIQPMIIEFKDPSSLMIEYQSKKFPFLEFTTETKGSFPYNGILKAGEIMTWLSECLGAEQPITQSIIEPIIQPEQITEHITEQIIERTMEREVDIIDTIMNSPPEELELFPVIETNADIPIQKEPSKKEGNKTEKKKIENYEKEDVMSSRDLERLVVNMNDEKFVGNSVQNIINDYPWLPYALVLIVSTGVTFGVVAGTALKNKYGGYEEDDLGPLLISKDGTEVDFNEVWNTIQASAKKDRDKDNNDKNNDNNKEK
jgi:hypothetical protein